MLFPPHTLLPPQGRLWPVQCLSGRKEVWWVSFRSSVPQICVIYLFILCCYHILMWTGTHAGQMWRGDEEKHNHQLFELRHWDIITCKSCQKLNIHSNKWFLKKKKSFKVASGHAKGSFYVCPITLSAPSPHGVLQSTGVSGLLDTPTSTAVQSFPTLEESKLGKLLIDDKHQKLRLLARNLY